MPRRGLVCALVVLTVGLGLAWVVITLRGPVTVYTVAQVAAGLTHQRRRWAGRTVVVRGIAVEVQTDVQGWGDAVETTYCVPLRADCPMALPTGAATTHVYLVDRLPRGQAAYRHLVASLTQARAQWPARPGGPPTLVLRMQSPRPQPLSGLLSWLQRPLDAVLSGATVVPPTPAVSGGTPHLYRIQLVPAPTPAWPGAPLTICTPACDDGVLRETP